MYALPAGTSVDVQPRPVFSLIVTVPSFTAMSSGPGWVCHGDVNDVPLRARCSCHTRTAPVVLNRTLPFTLTLTSFSVVASTRRPTCGRCDPIATLPAMRASDAAAITTVATRLFERTICMTPPFAHADEATSRARG